MVAADLLQKLAAAGTSEDVKAAAEAVAVAAKDEGVDDALLGALDGALGNADNGVAREGGALLFLNLCKKLKTSGLPHMTPRLMTVVNLGADKVAETKKAAGKAAKQYAKVATAPAVALVLDAVVKEAQESTKWQIKVLCLDLVGALVENGAKIMQSRMVELVPVLSALMWDSKKQVKEAAAKALTAACEAIDNGDIKPFVPKLVATIAAPEQVEETVHALAGTTFVQTVDASALSITVPLLERGYREKKTATLRKCAVITENLAKLVDDPREVAPFMSVLEPALAKASEEIADPEARSRCAAAHTALKDIAKRGGKHVHKEAELDKVQEVVAAVLKEKLGGNPEASAPAFDFVCRSAQVLCAVDTATVDDWKAALFGPLKALLPAGKNKKADAEEAAGVVMQSCLTDAAHAEGGQAEQFDEDEEDKKLELLCDCRFSLAYGSRILLNNARLFLRRGMRYGVIAPKSAGKTTLLQSIANGQVEGFPVDRLKTIFVETDIPVAKARMTVIGFTVDAVAEEMGIGEEECRKVLSEIGFNDHMIDGPVMALSGGWRMKLALARAMLRKADILLMDEPTNHLDVLNVQWVVDYLTGDSCRQVTSLIVSHDTKFLDKVATHIIHFETLKLSNYKGNMTSFVERFPHAQAYFDLDASALEFRFPQPGPLDGVKSKGRPILTMSDVSFRYPGAPKNQLNNVTIKVSMASRVACVGANGAGKSTMIKLLTGELKPSAGQVWKHPNCQFAYIAQHAFHHIEQHMDKTPVEYVLWRYQGGEDKEALVKATVKITEEEAEKMKVPIEIQIEKEDGTKIKEKRVVERLISRRKQGKLLEYEIKWVNKANDQNTWMDRDALIDRGFKKLVEDVDRRKAAAENAYQRVLTRANVAKHFLDVGLEEELSTHNRISALSGGEMVKVVLGAALWGQPHLVILDEPTNYLNREALGALAKAIRNFEGGVVLITHNQEFADATTRETWVVANHMCDIQGDADWAAYAAEALELAAAEDQLDASGNKIEKKRMPSDVPAKEKKKMMKELKKKIKEDLEMTDFEEACAEEWGLFAA